MGAGQDHANAVAVQADGKLVVAGWTAASTEDVAVLRYNADGTLDTTFNATASLRFGLRTASSLPPGTYQAPITFEVLAPNA